MSKEKSTPASVSKLAVVIAYAGGRTLSVTDTFDGIVAMILTADVLKDYEPLKITFKGTGKVLYFDKNLFAEFHHGGLHYSELIERTCCDELYRNDVEIEASGEVIEPGALWKLDGRGLTLVDDDKYVSYPMPREGFTIAK